MYILVERERERCTRTSSCGQDKYRNTLLRGDEMEKTTKRRGESVVNPRAGKVKVKVTAPNDQRKNDVLVANTGHSEWATWYHELVWKQNTILYKRHKGPQK